MAPTPHTAKTSPGYRGRFAPSPTGPLHFGSLVSAVASYLQARSAQGEWLLRIEDIDPPRETPGATEQIISSLQRHGFQWSEPTCYQSNNLQRFRTTVDDLLAGGHAFACTCSREQVRANGATGPVGPVYPGTCRAKPPSARGTPQAIRLRTQDQQIVFEDALQGRLQADVAKEIGDFIIRRKDGLIAYALAVVLDDHEQGITEIVRGCDLLHFTPAQIYLQRVLELNTPRYFHHPVVIDAAGVKLSKQTGARAVDDSTPARNLVDCLEFLNQQPPAPLKQAGVEKVWSWAIENWHPDRLIGCRKSIAPVRIKL